MCEKSKITFELDGKRYESAPAITTPNGHLCDGCAFEDDKKYDDVYCIMNVPVCQDVIFKEVHP